ncbi:pre-rRNA processing protein Mrd1 [Apiospora phragmitis]|uniref:Pre-rRNA processing protein Mrd1 n=1 Tax=Apiospora phragmitis TaxID=2905665 RepID=A0ABR1TB05_9PEZI
MSGYSSKAAERNGCRPIVTEEQREQIAASWVDELEPDLLYWLSQSADESHPRPKATLPISTPPMLRVTNIYKTVREADIRALFEEFGSIESLFLPRDSATDAAHGFAFITFTEPATPSTPASSFDYYGPPALLLEYPAEGELVCRDPPLRANVELQPMSPMATHATIVVATSWELTDSRKRQLEDAKKWVLGSTLGGRVFLTYETCEPASQ